MCIITTLAKARSDAVEAAFGRMITQLSVATADALSAGVRPRTVASILRELALLAEEQQPASADQ